MTSAAKKYPAFFKVFLPKCSSDQRLLIPIAFVTLTRFEKRVPKYFILRNYSGKGWLVEARCIGHKAPKALVVGKRGTAGSSATNNCGIDEEKYVHSNNPYFIAKLYKGRDNELHIPKILIDDYSLSLSQRIILLCCEHIGRNEPEKTHNRKNHGMGTRKVDKWKDGRVFIKGWASFCRRNKINIQNDTCICEFVLREDQEIQMLLVHVVKIGQNVS